MSVSVVRLAILNRRNISATYKGHRREMSPHVLGTKHGRFQAVLYQFGGTSSSGLGPDGSADNWRCMPVEQMEQVRILGGRWHSAPNATRPQTCVDDVDVEVSED